ncbi:hypothetical protein HDV00_006544 [Rhizophlyctis rosea]|nr:hypothetical protein HDV00_006544 [Rhizophlyctis rosea]
MQRLEIDNLHDLPFDFYNSHIQLTNFNLHTFLVRNDIHNKGVFRRLCGCYCEVPYGDLAAEREARLQETRLDDEFKARFQMLGLSMDLYPMDADFLQSVNPRSIDTWEAFYTVRRLKFDDPAALVLEVPVTIWRVLNK